MTHQPTPSPWHTIEIFVGDDHAGNYEHTSDLWLAREWAQDLARENPGEPVRVFEQQSLVETYTWDPEEGMRTGAAPAAPAAPAFTPLPIRMIEARFWDAMTACLDDVPVARAHAVVEHLLGRSPERGWPADDHRPWAAVEAAVEALMDTVGPRTDLPPGKSEADAVTGWLQDIADDIAASQRARFSCWGNFRNLI
jgi:hypothetical protein